MKTTAIEHLFFWSVYQPDRRIDFNGFYWRRADGGILFDPMPLPTESAAWLGEQEGGVQWIVLTNVDHLRAAAALRDAFGARIVAPETDRDALALEGCVDDWYGPARALPAGLESSLDVHWLRGGKTVAEAVLHLPLLGAILFGDAVRSHESGVLRLLPDEKLSDRERLVEDVAALRDLEFTAVLLGDGDCLFTGARAAFLELVD